MTQAEIRAHFTDGWRVDSIEASSIATTFGPMVAQAWLAIITRL